MLSYNASSSEIVAEVLAVAKRAEETNISFAALREFSYQDVFYVSARGMNLWEELVDRYPNSAENFIADIVCWAEYEMDEIHVSAANLIAHFAAWGIPAELVRARVYAHKSAVEEKLGREE
jgi:hypothetical protein